MLRRWLIPVAVTLGLLTGCFFAKPESRRINSPLPEESATNHEPGVPWQVPLKPPYWREEKSCILKYPEKQTIRFSRTGTVNLG